MLSVAKLDCLVVLAKAIERITQVAARPTFPSPVPQLTANVEIFVVELYRLVVLSKAKERITQGA